MRIFAQNFVFMLYILLIIIAGMWIWSFIKFRKRVAYFTAMTGLLKKDITPFSVSIRRNTRCNSCSFVVPLHPQ